MGKERSRCSNQICNGEYIIQYKNRKNKKTNKKIENKKNQKTV